jgi:predicted GIY-YIG superfamily endonuclease
VIDRQHIYRTQYLYCFLTADLNELKIGYTHNIGLRKKQHEKKRKVKLQVISAAPALSTEWSTRRMENWIHSELNHMLGRPKYLEWYPFEIEILEKFEELSGAIRCYGGLTYRG